MKRDAEGGNALAHEQEPKLLRPGQPVLAAAADRATPEILSRS